MKSLLKIGSAYKIKAKIFDAFLTEGNFIGRNINDDLTTDKYIGCIFTVLDTFEVSKNNFYYAHHRYLVLFQDKIVVFLINKNTMLENNINKYLEEVKEE